MKKRAKYESHLEFGCYLISSPLHYKVQCSVNCAKDIICIRIYIFTLKVILFLGGGGAERGGVVFFFVRTICSSK
jgi:hypothetical protein